MPSSAASPRFGIFPPMHLPPEPFPPEQPCPTSPQAVASSPSSVAIPTRPRGLAPLVSPLCARPLPADLHPLLSWGFLPEATQPSSLVADGPCGPSSAGWCVETRRVPWWVGRNLPARTPHQGSRPLRVVDCTALALPPPTRSPALVRCSPALDALAALLRARLGRHLAGVSSPPPKGWRQGLLRPCGRCVCSVPHTLPVSRPVSETVDSRSPHRSATSA